METLQAANRLAGLPADLGRKEAGCAERHRIVVSGLEVWRGDYCVCRDLSLTANAGQLVHLRGTNGAGKTSLLRVLAGLALPDSGDIRFDGARVLGDMNRWRAALCYVGHSDGIKRELTPYENLRLAASLLDRAARGGERVALDRVGLTHCADRMCAELSAGQRRRTALARLLVSCARIWLLDEPLVSLDQTGTQLLETLLREHLRAEGTAVVATHQPIDFSGLDVVRIDLPQGHELC